MSPNPPRLRRRLGHGGLSLLVAATGTTLLWSASAGTAAASPLDPTPECADGTCTVTFGATGSLQTFTVPDGVTSISASVSGASGGTNSVVTPPAGAGGRSSGTFAVQPGHELEVVVGSAGQASTDPVLGAARTYGGGGAGGQAWRFGSGGASGGGGSFLFDTQTLVLAAGGGGAASGIQAGGAGGGAGASAAAGVSAVNFAVGGLPGSLELNGVGGAPTGLSGSGEVVAPAQLPLGGDGGRTIPFPIILPTGSIPGGGGGGGFHAGGGGGGSRDFDFDLTDGGAGGGGGAGYAAAAVTAVEGQAGVQVGDGQIVLTYADHQQVTFSSDAPTHVVVGSPSYTVAATGTGTADVTLAIDPLTTNGACTLDGTVVSFVHAGTCVIAADQAADADHGAGRATQTITVGKGTRAVVVTNLPATGTVGQTFPVSATGDVPGADAALTVGQGSPCSITSGTLTLTGEGTCTVVAARAATDDFDLVVPIVQTIAIERTATTTSLAVDPAQPVFGQAATVIATVTGADEGTVDFTVASSGTTSVDLVDGKASLPLPALHAGAYTVSAVFTPSDVTTFAGSAEQTVLTVGQAGQTITFDQLAATGSVGDELPLKATGGDSGNDVTLTVDPVSTEGACAIEGTTLKLTGKGTCTVVATQVGDADHSAAVSVSHTVEVTQVSTTTTLSFDPEEQPVFGQDVRATVKVSGIAAGDVQLFVDGEAYGDPVAVDADGTASKALPDGLAARGHEVKAVFTPTDAVTYAGSEAGQTLAIARARTTTTVKVRSDQASVVVAAVAPGKGTPAGDVVFTVGTTSYPAVELDHGKATLSHAVPAGATVGVVYAGDDAFAGSSDSTLRTDPTITAAVTSTTPVSPFGWYRTPVKISFTCTEGSAALVDACPGPVTLSQDGASQGVTRTVTAEDGGVATASVTGINVDRTAPEVAASDVEEGQRFFATAPDASCVGTDELSGILGCKSSRDVNGKSVTYHLAAVDRAGNVAELDVHAAIYVRGIIDAQYVDGAYTVRSGQAYTLVAKSTRRAQVLKPVLAPKLPSKTSTKFKSTGKDLWALGYTIDKSLKVGKTYNLGIKTDKKYSIMIRVVA